MPTTHLPEDQPGYPDFTHIELADVIDVSALQEMMDDYYALTGIGVGIIDLSGQVLVGTGWQDICVKFHRAVPQSCAFCHESDTSLSMNVPPGTFKEYRCKNNMWDIATPIMLGDRQIGSIFLGQFLYDDETPDYELFRAQARRFGYDEEKYLAALDRVPRWSRETVQRAMGYYSKLAGMISKTNYNNFVLADSLARQKQAEETLRQSEEKFAKIFNAAPSLLVISTIAEGRLIDVNEAFEHFTGYRRIEALGRTSVELKLWSAETRNSFINAIGKDIRVRDFEAPFQSKDGEQLVGLVSAEVIVIKGEACLLVLVKDITERKQAEDRLKESERLLNRAQIIGQLGSWSFDLMANRLIWSDEIYRLLGLPQQEAPPTYEEFLESVHPEDRVAVKSAYSESIRAGRSGYENEHRIISKDNGELRYIHEKCEHIRNASGRVIRSEGMMHDITERKRAEACLRFTELKYSRLFQSMTDAYACVDKDGRIVESNSIFQEMTGYSPEELASLTYFQLTPEKWHTAEAEIVEQQVLARGYSDLFQKEYRRKNGAIIDVELKIFLLKDETDSPIRMWAIIRDITARKHAEQELQMAKTAAEVANIAKSRFLATMSHEIRTPMNGVIGMIQLLQHTGLTADQQNYAEIAKKSGFELLHLLNDILELSKIEADKLELELSAFDLRLMIADTIDFLSLSSRGKEIQLVSSIESDVPMTLKGDAGRLRQLITNIAGNAIKFTAKGKVTLHIQKDREDENSTTLRFLVSDSGIGIPADKLEHIFAPFTQVDNSTTRKFGGTGLGLAICKRLTELMGGDIGVESTEGVGSTFWFTVILAKPAIAELAPPKPVSPPPKTDIPATGKGLRLLLAEDDPTAQKLVHALLSQYGYNVDLAENGKEALLALASNDYALVLMDCMMPEMNGYEATAAIRDPTSNVRRHDIPIIALTGNAMKGDRDRCLAVGMDDYLSKPFILKDLLAKLNEWSTRG